MPALTAIERESLLLTAARIRTANQEVERIAEKLRKANPEIASELLALKDVLRRPTQSEAQKSYEAAKRKRTENQEA